MERVGWNASRPVRPIVLGCLGAVAIALAGSTVLAKGPVEVATGGATLTMNDAPAGLIVTSLETGGMSAVAGLRVGDVIDRVGGQGSPTPDILVRAEADPVVRLHIAARGDAGARTLVLRRPTEDQGEDPDRRGR